MSKIGLRWMGIGVALLLVSCDAEQTSAIVATYFAPAVLAVTGTLGTWALAEAVTWLRSRTTDARLLRLLTRAESAIPAAVDRTAQVFVADLKARSADGKLTREEAGVALRSAVNAARGAFGDAGREEAIREFGGAVAFDSWLTTMIEAEIERRKSGKARS